MNPVQLYETTIRDNDSNLAFSFIVVPNRSLTESDVRLTGSQSSELVSRDDIFIEQLGLRPLQRLDPDNLENALAGLLANSAEIRQTLVDISFVASLEFHLDRLARGLDPRVGQQELQFARFLTEEAVVPFENSPLHGVSLQSLSKASPYALGAYIGFVVSGSTPMLLLTVPAGIILCGAAAGIGEGLNRGLRDRLQYLLAKKGRAKP
ncbi:hypothetical protein [Derxia gummosa]|uniref:Uncharacterized protein n=1 Tax=Derxia gummosa DSM 723 TaxID=1121388 RepID=A0A8B6XCN9_9BURK|nr:hypothetical protein [Derxia gummosa]